MKELRLFFKRTALSANVLAVKLQGYLMGQISDDYAEFLHQQETNPYASFVIDRGDQQVWTVSLLTEQACEQLQEGLLSLQHIQLDSYAELISIQKIEWRTLSVDQLMAIFNADGHIDRFSIRFLTPTTFKSSGDYLIFPTTRLIFQSLMQKYSRLYPDVSNFDPDLLDYLTEHSRITRYRLQTHYFSVHKNKIPAFRGSLTIKVTGASTLRAFAQMLFAFGEFSGVGAKTSMGMGGIEIE